MNPFGRVGVKSWERLSRWTCVHCGQQQQHPVDRQAPRLAQAGQVPTVRSVGAPRRECWQDGD